MIDGTDPHGDPDLIASPELLLERELRRREHFSALLAVTRAVSHTLDLDEILVAIAKQVRQVIACDECTVYRFDEHERVLRPASFGYEIYVEEMRDIRFELGQGLSGWVAQHRQGVIVPDTRRDPRVVHIPGTPDDESSMLCVPMLARDELIGVITLESNRLDGFDAEDLELATLFAGPCGSAIANARLFAETRAAYDELNRAQAQLVQAAKLNALGEMAGGVAHGFNNVLASILGRTQLLQHAIEDPGLREQLDVIERAARDGAHIVRRIQEFTRVRQDEVFEPIGPSDLVRDVIDLVRPVIEYRARKLGRGLDWSIQLEATRAIAGAAPDLREALLNIVLNAIDAMPEGGRLRVTTHDEGEDVVLRVIDEGVGMDENVRSRLFEPFFTTKGVSGMGLGSSVAYGIVSRHRAKIEVESAPGRGTTVALRFPAVELPSAAAEEGPRRSATPARILCVDDDSSVLDVLTDMLSAQSQEPTRALGGRAAIEALRAGTYDIVFTDLGMPDVTGWDVVKAAREIQPAARVVLVTGWGSQIDPETARNNGVDAILTKPFSWDELQQRVAELSWPRAA